MRYLVAFAISTATVLTIAILVETLRRRFGFDPVNRIAELVSQRDATGAPLTTPTEG